ncbi:Ubiquitin carboxyl-terminal hydrolase 48 [Psilocybe cubensis]|uniref:Ubiquitin carboxyl-terminal hydrolase 48 n=1 Tax=Psilocybe cubensis TaxID=181762 RepID=A0ACB8H6Z3_PSICU|nr:Ubiquitin carboxyl-terminal hydrolase 48 [Psilocybe cubensis]KAH9483698.1 Ubiquitin carboxyl-terminal hydrolase 48 [Psilocybe cubensis]
MAPKRKRNASSPQKGLPPGEKLKRDAIPGASSSSPWGWVGSQVVEPEQITLDHRLSACNLSRRNNNAFCRNKYSQQDDILPEPPSSSSITNTNGELVEDIIVISDDDTLSCSKKDCKTNPNCLNYLGQESWEDEDAPEDKLFKFAKLGRDPCQNTREVDLPVGLKNLGATCYANASLQVWYRDLAFRSGVFSCEPPEGVQVEKYKESPIFQLQVTFAALQKGNQKSFNPTKLVESLQLRASEQQDAQEFSKLFMSHLDVEFKKQTSAVKSLITEQFQGSQAYGTICHSCKNRSERPSDFLEVEISFDNNSTLEDRIAASLLPETLSGDNKYFCSRCESLQDATRYTELRQLPPVLHFSLLRFVYDVSTMERKKSKHSIAFPLVLDMQKYIGSKNARKKPSSADNEDNIYELRGILLHKGTSAYHGHYEAQVHDAEYKSWYQFNDETVTRITTLGDKFAPQTHEDSEEKLDQLQVRKNRINARKRKRIEDSDDEIVDLITSKDAYMLIYAKKSNATAVSNPNSSVTPVSLLSEPPVRAMEVIQTLNAEHENACKHYKEKEEDAKSRFQELCHKVRNIYRNWSLHNDSEDSVVVSRQALESWLSEDCVSAMLKESGLDSAVDNPSRAKSNSPTPTKGTELPIVISNADITCEHGLIDPQKFKDIKRINQRMYNEIVNTTNCTFEPLLRPHDACSTCVESIFKEKLYELDHPKQVKQFDEISSVADDELGYWISKKWVKDWKLMKPKMHIPSVKDPGPDSGEFRNHVLCEHDGLTLNTINRRKISVEAMQLLSDIFPAWKPPSSNTETCAVCDAEVHISKEDKKEIRRKAEEEKATWRRWVNNPTDNTRPEIVDNKIFLCQHDHLIFDPNCTNDLDSTILIIERNHWDELQSMKTEWETAEIYIRIRGPEEPKSSNIDSESPPKIKPKPATYGRNTDGSRQSRRLRQMKEQGQRRRVQVSKATTVKELKMMANEEFSIPTICQRLFYQGRELEDNAETVAILKISPNDIIDLKEQTEILEITSDSDEPPSKKRREGRGFGGTLLGCVGSSSPERTPGPTFTNLVEEKPCLACTFSNGPDAVSCEMCETPFS